MKWRRSRRSVATVDSASTTFKALSAQFNVPEELQDMAPLSIGVLELGFRCGTLHVLTTNGPRRFAGCVIRLTGTSPPSRDPITVMVAIPFQQLPAVVQALSRQYEHYIYNHYEQESTYGNGSGCIDGD